MKKLLLIAACVVGMGMSQVGRADSIYTGSLAGSSELYGAGEWQPTETMPTISWQVSQIGVTAEGNALWKYAYTWMVMEREISHVIIEVTKDSTWETSDFTILWDETTDGVTYGGYGYFGPSEGNSNPGIPEALYGIKFEVDNLLTATFAFTTDHAPVWGDFYSKDGNALPSTYAYNLGFTGNDTDPSSPPADGSVDKHILRPNGPVHVPDGGLTALMLGLGVLGVGYMARRKS